MSGRSEQDRKSDPAISAANNRHDGGRTCSYLLSIFMRRSAGAGAAAIVGIAVDRSADSANRNTNPAGPYREGLVVRTGLGRKENHQRRSIQSQGPNGGLEDLADWFSSQNYESAKRKIRERAN